MFIERLEARFFALTMGMEVSDARTTIYPVFNMVVNGVRMRPKWKALDQTWTRLDYIVAAVDAAARRIANAHPVRSEESGK